MPRSAGGPGPGPVTVEKFSNMKIENDNRYEVVPTYLPPGPVDRALWSDSTVRPGRNHAAVSQPEPLSLPG
eukprot:390981-Hanusia_phi.AAC.1